MTCRAPPLRGEAVTALVTTALDHSATASRPHAEAKPWRRLRRRTFGWNVRFMEVPQKRGCVGDGGYGGSPCLSKVGERVIVAGREESL